MRPRYQLRPILLIEHLDSILPKDVAGAARADSPTFDLLWVAPHEVAHGPLVWHLLLPIDRLDLVQRVYVGAQPAMHAKDLLVNYSCQGQKVHNLSAIAPYIDRAVLAKTLIIKAINLCDLP